MSSRLPIPAARIAEVATAALVCRQTVEHYLDGRHLLRVTEAAITRAVRALPPGPQMEIPCTGAEFAAAAQAAIEPRSDEEIADIIASIQGDPVTSIPAPEGDTSVDILADKSQLSTRGDCGIRGQAPVRAGGAETASIQPVHSEKPNDFTVGSVVDPCSKPSRCAPPVRRCRVTILDERGEVVTP